MPIALIPPFSHRREKGGDSRLSSCSWANGEKWVSGLLRRSVLSPYRPVVYNAATPQQILSLCRSVSMSVADTYQLIHRLAPEFARTAQQAAAQAHNEAEMDALAAALWGLTPAEMAAIRANLEELKGEGAAEGVEEGEV